MNGKLLPLLTFVTLISVSLHAEWIPFKPGKTAAEPVVTLLSDDQGSSVFKIDISGYDLRTISASGKSYHRIDFLTDMFTTEPGNPEVPYLSKILAVPDEAGISFEILETGDMQVIKNINLPPARESWWEGDPEPAYDEHGKAFQTDGFYPKEMVRIEDPAIFRDFRIARVSVFPARYNPVTREMQVATSVTVKVKFGKGEVINPKTTPSRKIAPSFGDLYKSFIFNYQSVADRLYGGKEEGHDLMLCIMPDEFVASFQIYADWKRQSGIDIHVTKFSDIGANGTNPDIVKNYIASTYLNWEVAPTYVLIIGDEGIFPHKIVTYPDYSFPSDDYFVEIEGNDYFPEMFIGRFTNQGDYRMQVMLKKFMLYEQTPYMANTQWFKKATVCANNEYESQVETKRFTYHRMMDYGNFYSVDTLMSDGNGWGYDCSVDLQDVLNAINNGRSYLNYRGEGWYSGWSAACYDFHTDDVSSLNNGEKFTFVTSIGCGVAGFHASGGNCFGEEWVEMGSLTAPRGGAAFIGPTSNTHTTYNNRIDKGIYVGMFNEGMETPGQALLRGKLYMYNVFGNDYYTQYHYKIYHVLGDPSIHIWRDVPQNVNTDYPSSIPVGNNFVEFTVTSTSLNQPVAHAQVTVTGQDIFASGFTDSTGKVILNIHAEAEETLTVTTRGINVYPSQTTLEVIQYQELIEPDGDPVVVDLNGNNDGLVNPNENVNMTFTLKNWGVAVVSGVQATLSVLNTPDVTVVTPGAINYGTIAPGNTATGSPFTLSVQADCPIGQVVNLQLHVTTASNSWDYLFSFDVVGCELAFDNFVVHDAGAANMNFRVDPGETDVLVVSVKNTGVDIAPEVYGTLSTNDPYVTVIDESGYFGNVSINGTARNTSFNFMISVDESCPAGHLAHFSINLNTSNGFYPYEVSSSFEVPVGLPVPKDYSGPDAYGYYAYSSDDSFYDETPVYNWIDINQTGTQIALPASSDYTQTINLPFSFKYYGVSYNQVRISTDGWLAFGSGTQTAPVNAPLPSNDNVNSMVAPFWDDLYDTEFFMGKIFYYNDYISGRFIIEWDSISRNNFVSEPVREDFQVILLNPNQYPTLTGDGEIIVQYKFMEEMESSTVGIEDHTQTIGLQYVFNNNYSQTSTALANEMAIKFTTDPPFQTVLVSVDDASTGSGFPDGFGLRQNHPNPFSEQTMITLSLPEGDQVTLNIFNSDGKLVRKLHSGYLPAGAHSFIWDGLNHNGNRVGQGMYFYQLQTPKYLGTEKMFLIK